MRSLLEHDCVDLQRVLILNGKKKASVFEYHLCKVEKKLDSTSLNHCLYLSPSSIPLESVPSHFNDNFFLTKSEKCLTREVSMKILKPKEKSNLMIHKKLL